MNTHAPPAFEHFFVHTEDFKEGPPLFLFFSTRKNHMNDESSALRGLPTYVRTYELVRDGSIKLDQILILYNSLNSATLTTTAVLLLMLFLLPSRYGPAGTNYQLLYNIRTPYTFTEPSY